MNALLWVWHDIKIIEGIQLLYNNVKSESYTIW